MKLKTILRSELIEIIRMSDNTMTQEQAEDILKKAENYCVKHKEKTFLCLNIDSIYLCMESYLTHQDVVVGAVEHTGSNYSYYSP